jgi:hypothetical protein
MNLNEQSTNPEELMIELFKIQNRIIGLNYDVIEQLILLYPNDADLGKEIRRIYNKLND